MLSGRPYIQLLSDERQLALERMARSVAEHLEHVGLPINWQGNSALQPFPKAPGARVFYDPSADSSGGVYVKWRVSSDMLQAAMEEGPESKSALIGGVSMDVMLDTLGRLLESAGWVIDRVNTGVHESSIKVVGITSIEEVPT